jgi:hypothetical protein
VRVRDQCYCECEFGWTVNTSWMNCECEWACVTHSHSHSLTSTHTHTHSHSLTLTHSYSLSLTYTHRTRSHFTHSHSLTLTHTHLHSLTLTLVWVNKTRLLYCRRKLFGTSSVLCSEITSLIGFHPTSESLEAYYGLWPSRANSQWTHLVENVYNLVRSEPVLYSKAFGTCNSLGPLDWHKQAHCHQFALITD